MNLKSFFKSSKNESKPEYFLAVEIHESLIKSVCWEISDGSPSVVQVGSFESWQDEESLINGVDASITDATKNLSVQPKRIVLGLPESWFEENDIHPTKKVLIKKILTNLDLEAIGVVSSAQAITHYLKQKEGIPPTAILIEIFPTKVVVSVLRLGHIETFEEVGSSGDIARDVEEALARTESDKLPARFLLTNGSNLDEEQQQLISFPWQDRLPFVHMPKVEVLPTDFSIRAVAMTGGAEAAQKIGINVTQTPEKLSTGFSVETDENSNLTVPTSSPPMSLEELGFSYEETFPPSEIPDYSSENTPQVIDNTSLDSEDRANPIQVNEIKFTEQEITSSEYAVPDSEISHVKPFSKKSFSFKKLKIPSFKISLPRKGAVIFVPLLLLVILGGITAYYFFMGSAEIIVTISPQSIQKNLVLSLSETNTTNESNLTVTKGSFTGETKQEITTTGETKVGDKASGTVTIANRTVAPLVLKTGTIFSSDSGGGNFSLAEEVTIASKSADPLTFQETYGQATNVTLKATKIGAESNLSKNTTFTISDYSKSIAYAVAENDFTGGSSRVVRAVSAADQQKLLDLATGSIAEQVSSRTNTQGSDNRILTLGDVKYTQKEFSHNLNEETDLLTLNLAGEIEYLSYQEGALYNYLTQKLSTEIPPGMVIDDAKLDYQLNPPVTISDGNYQSQINLNAKLKPQIDETQWSDLIKGKTLSFAKNLLTRISGYEKTSAKISPPIPYLSTNFLPLKNITIQIVTE